MLVDDESHITELISPREQLLEHLWEYTFKADASMLETYISYLRQKVDATEPRLIHTVRGVGYSLRLPQS